MADPSQPAVVPRHAGLALLVGPLAHLVAGRRRRAAVAGGLRAIPLVAYAYVAYFLIFLAIDAGGESAREVTDTALKATELWILAAPTWVPGGWWVLALANLACAADLWRLARGGAR